MDPADNADAAMEIDIPCPECDYNLKGIASERCPSCGWEIDYDLLLAQAGARPDSRRYAVAFAAAFIGAGTLFALASLSARSRPLSLSDGFLVLAVALASAGHVALAVLAMVRRKRWPMRTGTAADLINFVGWMSIILGVIGAAQFLTDLPAERVVRGVVVSGVLEFLVIGMLVTLPGAMLLVLKLVSFSDTASLKASTAREYAGSSLPVRASFSIDFVGPCRSEQISQTWNSRARETTPAIEELIAQTWERQSRRAVQLERPLHDGRLVRLIQTSRTPSGIQLELGLASFRDFLGTNLYNAAAVQRIKPGALADALGISAVVLCDDHVLAFGRRADSVAFHARHLHTFGGLVEESDCSPQGGGDLFAAMRRELQEEAAVGQDEIREMVVLGLVRDRELLQPELVFDVWLTISSRELRSRFRPADPGQEHSALEFVFGEPDAVIPFLRRAAPVAPVAEAAMLLHGRRHFGNEWYEQTCYILFGELPPPTPPTPQAWVSA